MWVAVIMLCSNPHIASCELVVNNRLFNDFDQCSESVFQGARKFSENEFYALGRCIEVPMLDV
tara:strand:+ start:818 stop:1006 length:189 start_codon:yes stop_codon:yes gene_type:complete